MTIRIDYDYCMVAAALLMLAKILGIVQWSWWTVTAPLWIVPVFIGVAFTVVCMAALIGGIVAIITGRA